MFLSVEEMKRIRKMERSLAQGGHNLFKHMYGMGFPIWINDPNFTAGVSVDEKNRVIYQFGVEFFDQLKEPELIGVIAHECLHWVLNHPQRRGDRNPRLWNIACDAVINAIVQEWPYYFPLPEGAIQIADLEDKLGIHGLKHLNAEHLYDVLNKYPHRSERMEMSVCTGNHDNWEEMNQDRCKEVQDQVVRTSVKEASDDGDPCAGAGTGESETLRTIWDIWTDDSIPWDDLLEGFLGSLWKPGIQDTWVKPERKLQSAWPDVLLPRRDDTDKPDGCKILAAVDVSGSIGQELLDRFAAILRSLPPEGYEVQLACWDTTFTLVNDLKTFRGGGGTVLDCVVRGVEKMKEKPDIVIVVTDGDFYLRCGLDPENWVFVVDGKTGRVPVGARCFKVGAAWKARHRRKRI